MSYGKVHDVFWDDDRIEGLSDRAALLALFLISGPHRNAIGCFKLGLGAITDNPRFAGWGSDAVGQTLDELIGIGFIARDARSGWTLIRNTLKHDPIKSLTAAIGAAKLAAAVPASMPFYGELRAKLSPQIEAARGSHAVAGYPLRDPSHGQSGPIDAPSMPLRSPEPSPQPQPEPQPAACVDDDDVAGRTGCDLRATVRAKVERLLDSPSIVQFNRIDAWLEAGADPERDIYPTIAAGLNKLGKPPASLKYFDGAIADAIAARKAPLPPGRARGGVREIPESGAYVAPVRNPAAEAFRLDSYVEIIAAGRNPGLGCSSQDVRRLLKAGRVTVEQCQRAGCSP